MHTYFSAVPDKINCQHILIHLNLLIPAIMFIVCTVRAVGIKYHFTVLLYSFIDTLRKTGKRSRLQSQISRMEKNLHKLHTFQHRFCGGVEKTTQVDWLDTDVSLCTTEYYCTCLTSCYFYILCNNTVCILHASLRHSQNQVCSTIKFCQVASNCMYD